MRQPDGRQQLEQGKTMINDVLSGLAAGSRPAPGSRASTSATEAIAASGNALPASGGGEPAAAAARPAPAPADLSRVVEQMNRFLASNQRDLNFRVDEASGRTVITVLNPSTGEIVRQIPPEELLSVARTMRVTGMVFAEKA